MRTLPAEIAGGAQDDVLPLRFFDALLAPVNAIARPADGHTAPHSSPATGAGVHRPIAADARGSAVTDKLTEALARRSAADDEITQAGARRSAAADKITQAGARTSATADKLTQAGARASAAADRLTQAGARKSATADGVTQAGVRKSATADEIIQASARKSATDRLTQAGARGRQPATAGTSTRSGARGSATAGELRQAFARESATADRLAEALRRESATADQLTRALGRESATADALTQAGARESAIADQLTQAGARESAIADQLTQARARESSIADALTQAGARESAIADQLTQARARESATADELARAAEVQRALLPKPATQLPGYQISGACIPATAVGGDFFDWYPVRGGLGFTLGDVMGKGAGAAIIAATARAVIRSARDVPDPVEALTRTDATLGIELGDADSFATVFHARLRDADGRVEYADAGHGLTILVRSDGSWERLSSDDPPLGLGLDTWRQAKEAVLEPGDMIVSVSDGVLDLYDGSLRALDHVADLAISAGTADEVVAALKQEAMRGSNTDDVTVLAVRRIG